MDTVEIIDKNLREKLEAKHVEIIDESHLHRGHKAAGGGGHYSVRVYLLRTPFKMSLTHYKLKSRQSTQEQ